MAVYPAQITVAGSAIRLDSTPESTTDKMYGQSVWVTVGSADIYVGGTNAVTTSGGTRGRLVKAGTDFTVDISGADALWAISAGSSVCEVLQVGV